MGILRDWRSKKGWTQSRLAEEIGAANNSLISKLESGNQLPSLEMARRIEAATGGEVTAAELLGVASNNRTGVAESAAQFVHSELDPALLEEAASYGLDAPKIARAAVERAVKTERMKRFSEKNREAIESWNELVEREGLWSDGLRAF